MIEVKDEMLQQAAGEGMDAFIKVFTDAYMEALGGRLTAENMALLTGEQHTLLAYVFFRDEVMEGGGSRGRSLVGTSGWMLMPREGVQWRAS